MREATADTPLALASKAGLDTVLRRGRIGLLGRNKLLDRCRRRLSTLPITYLLGRNEGLSVSKSRTPFGLVI